MSCAVDVKSRALYNWATDRKPGDVRRERTLGTRRVTEPVTRHLAPGRRPGLAAHLVLRVHDVHTFAVALLTVFC